MEDEAAEGVTRRERLIEGRRRRRRQLAGALAAVGLAAIAIAVAWEPESESTPASARTGGEVDPAIAGLDPGRPPSTAPGGVGPAPEKTGLPAVPAPGGKVRTGSEDEGCFSDIRSYLDEWHRTGREPDPCFTSQEPSDQKQPDGVRRTYNGERF